MDVVRVENFSEAEMERAAKATGQFDVVFLFTTKWEPPHPLWKTLPFGEALQKRFFDYHEDITPERAAAMLGGRIVRYQNRNNEWVAIIAIERVENARMVSSFQLRVSSDFIHDLHRMHHACTLRGGFRSSATIVPLTSIACGRSTRCAFRRASPTPRWT